MSLSPACGWARGTGLLLVAAFLVAFLIEPASKDKVDFTNRNTLSADKQQTSSLLKHHEVSAVSYRFYFPESLNSPVKLMSQGRRCEFTLEEMSYNAGDDYLGSPYPTSPEIGDDTVTYPEAFEHVDVEYHLTTQGIKEFFVLKQPPNAPADHLMNPTLDFAVAIDADDLRIFIDGVPASDHFTTEKSIEFVDEANGETIFVLPAPYAVDAAGNAIPIRYKVQTRGNKARVYTQTPYAWLADPARAYPVKIDPETTIAADYSIVLVGGATWDDTLISSGQWEDDSWRTGIDFDTTSIPDTATITKVELKLYIDEESGTPPNNDADEMTQTAYDYHITDDDKSGFNADVDGNDYLSNSSGFDGDDSYHTVELLPAARTDLQSQLGANWFSVGWTGTTEAGNNYRDGHTWEEANPPQLIVTYVVPAAALTGTLSDDATEAQIVSGGQTLIITLTDTTWDATIGADNGLTTALINGIDSGGAETYGWDAVVKTGLTHANVTRTSDTVVTITLPAFTSYCVSADETITVTVPASTVATAWDIVATPTFDIIAATTSAALTGTLADDATEAQIVSGGETLIITLTNATWDATVGADNPVTTALINGLDSDGVEANGWDAVVKAGLTYANVTRTSDTVVTITLPAFAGYCVNADETITVTVPATAVSDCNAIVATPTFDIIAAVSSAALTGTLADNATEAQIVSGGETLIITLTSATWDATVGADNAVTTALINGLDSAGSEPTGWDAVVKANMDYNDVVRTSDTVVTITLGAEPTYDITALETITVTVPATAVSDCSAIVAGTTFDITIPSAAVSGTITPSAAESEIVSGGKTIIIDLAGDTWVAAGATFDAQRQNIIDSITSAMTATTGWNNEVRDNQGVSGVVRTSNTRVTITLDAQAAYNITATEVITVTVPASALTTSSEAMVAAPVFVVTIDLATTTVYQVQNVKEDWSLDTICDDKSGGEKVDTPIFPQTTELIKDDDASCSADEKGDKIKVDTEIGSTDEETLLVAYFDVDGDQQGYDVDTVVSGLSTGHDIFFNAKEHGGTFRIRLIEADPSDGSVLSVLDTYSEDLNADDDATANPDLSGLSGTVPAGSTFGFQFTFEADDDRAEPEIKWGEYNDPTHRVMLNLSETPLPPIAAVSGTIMTYKDEYNVVNGGQTIYIDLINDTWVAAGAIFNAQRQNIINGLTSAQSESAGWNAEVKANQGAAGVVRTSDTRVTITLDAQADYAISADETITVTVPATAVTSAGAITGTPTFVIRNTCPFDYRRSITIDYTKVGTDNTGTLPATGFPVLVSLSGDWLKTTTEDPTNGRIENADGSDIIFRESTSWDQLHHEIEEYDGDNGVLVAWVRVDSLSKSADTVIDIYYGNKCIIAPTEDPENVWDAGFKGVWHLNNGDSTATDFYEDSTINNEHGTLTDANGNSAAADGKISDAFDFAGDNDDDFIERANFSQHLTTAMTISGWVKPASSTPANFDGYFGIRNADVDHSFYILQQSGTNNLECRFRNSAGGVYSANIASAVTGGSWSYVVLTYDGDDLISYIDGEIGTENTDATGSFSSSAYPFRMGTEGGGNELDGIVDEVRVSNTPRDADWIKTEFNNQSDITIGSGYFIKSLGSEVSSPPTAVTLLSFTATGQDDSVQVSWETAQEVLNMGFHLYRAHNPDGPYTRVNDSMIPALTFSVGGRAYTYTDADVVPGQLYYYRLEDLDVRGNWTSHGPICVDWDNDGLPDDWEIAYGLNPDSDDAGLDLDGDGLTNLQEYQYRTDPLNPDTDGDGIPDGEESGRIDRAETAAGWALSSGVQVVASDAGGIILELRTDSFDTETIQAEGTVYQRLRIADYIHGQTQTVGSPELPVKGILFDLPEGKSAAITLIDTESRAFDGYTVYPVPEKTAQTDSAGAYVAEQFSFDETAYGKDAFYPATAARLGATYVFRGQPKQQVLFQPLAYNPLSGELVLNSRIRVRIDYQDTAQPSAARSLVAADVAAASPRALAWAPPTPGPANPAYKILVDAEGIYRVAASSAGLTGAVPDQVRMYHRGQEVAIRIDDQGIANQLDGSDYIEFYGQPVAAPDAKYAKYNVYWLTDSGVPGGLRMAAIDGAPASAPVPTTHAATVHYEKDEYYISLAPGADSLDRWFFSTFVLGSGFTGGGAPVPADFTLALPDVAGTMTGDLKISLLGFYDTDHEVVVAVNGTPVGTYTWSGIAYHEVTIDNVALLDGNNTVTLQCNSGSDPLDPDGILVDWFQTTYDQGFAASGNTLKFTHAAGSHYQISGFSGASGNDLAVYDVTAPDAVRQVDNGVITGADPYTLDMEPQDGAGERTYLVLAEDMVKSPAAIIADEPANLSDAANGADYILITHRDLGWNGAAQRAWLTTLVNQREAQGLRVKAVVLEDVYDEFGHGIETPEAIRDFLAHAFGNWTPPAPQYVLLVGDSTYDPKDILGLGTVNMVPSYLTYTDHYGETVSDDWFARISGSDFLPDLYIGRLPAGDVTQAADMVAKIIDYENGVNFKTWEKNTLLVADDQTEAYEAVFEIMNNDVAALIPTSLNPPFEGYLESYAAPALLTADIAATINAGSLIVNYSGHGAVPNWALNIFDTADAAALTNTGMLPFVVSMTCLNGYFADPGQTSLAETLLRTVGTGAVATLMSTGMTAPEGQHVLDTALFEAIFSQDIRVLGAAISTAKQTLLANGANFEDVSSTFLLFGDPATVLKVTVPTMPTSFVLQGQAGDVTLSWQAAADCNGNPVAGYNVYRSTTAGGPYIQLNSVPITETTYRDITGAAGTAYYYMVSAVDSDSDESAPTAARSLGVPSSGATASGGGGGGGGGCFINTVGGR